MYIKRFQRFVFTFIFFLLLFMPGCAKTDGVELSLANQSTVASDKQRLTISWKQDIGELDPHGYSPNQMFAQNLVYESLVTFRSDGTIAPHLASKWEISNDGKEYTFTLRDDVLFSDGSTFNAAIVKRNFDRVLQERDQHSWLELVNQIESIELLDEYRLVIHLKNPYYPLLQELALVRPFRFLGETGFPQEDTNGINEPIGTGPWVLSEYKKDQMAVFKRNELYWGEQPKLDEVAIKIIPDSESRVIAFENGEIDLIYGNGLISLDSYKYLKDSGLYETGQSEATGTRALAINSNRGPTEDLSVRQAILHAFNTESLIREVFYGTEIEAGTLFAANVPYSDLGLQNFEYDPDRAIKLLETAGWTKTNDSSFRSKDDEELQLELSFDYSDQIQKTIAEIMQGELRQVGIDLVLLGEERQSFLDRQKTGQFHLIFNNTWGAPYDPYSFVSAMRIPTHADYAAQAGLSMKGDIDEAITNVLLSQSEEEQQEYYRYILSTLHEQAIYLPISYTTNIAIHHPYVKSVEYSSVDYDFKLEKIELN
ncbi:nickel ABC transporter, nickel/metallophore periplasmic binding protein [Alkalihalophilus pseudofirmus]|nr:nickel ABC transporter, nickel/metallophore periplasmic binding protein [Alkalihalophilus pseudofirmus]